MSRPAPPRAAALQAPGLALRRQKDIAVPIRLKRSRAALLIPEDKQDGRGRPRSGRGRPDAPHSGEP